MTTTNHNLYADLSTLRGLLKREDRGEDDILLTLVHRSSRLIDNYCGRNFYVATATKNFRSKYSSHHLFLIDLISITTITVDGVALDSDDYELEPLNEYPKTRLRLLYGTFGNRQEVAIDGKWGYEEIYDDSGDTVQDDPLTSSATTLTPSSVDNFSIGQMLLIESEQAYVSDKATSILTVIRAQNGTTAAQHTKNTAISIMRAPEPIIQACAMQTIRFYRGRDAAYSNVTGGAEAAMQFKEPALEIRVLLNPYKRYDFGEQSWS